MCHCNITVNNRLYIIFSFFASSNKLNSSLYMSNGDIQASGFASEGNDS